MWRNSFKSESDNLLIILYQLIKFQAPSWNSFWDILLTSLKLATVSKFKINLEGQNYVHFDAIHVYLKRNLADKLEMPQFAKGHNLGNILQNLFEC